MQVHFDALLHHSVLILGHVDGYIEVQFEECEGQHTALVNVRGVWEHLRCLPISPDCCSGLFLQGSNDGQQLLW